MKIASVQMISGPEVGPNLATAARLVGEAAAAGARLVALPEYFPLIGASDEVRLAARETPGAGPIQDFLAELARRHGIWLVGGSIPLAARDPGKLRNSCLVFDDQGRQVARYDKIHLFGFNRGDEHYDEAATIEPLSEHLDFYEAHLAQNFLSGVQACYRGTRLYDTETTRAAVKKWVDLYKRHRAILDSDIIHLRRPDGRTLDGLLHVNPSLPTKGLAVFYNPTDREIAETWEMPLYYTGLADEARISERDGAPVSYRLDRLFRVRIEVRLAPGRLTWFVIE